MDWPKCGEIDIMEHINDESKTYATLHWDNNGHAMYGTDTNLSNADDWHIYSTSWDANFVNISVDGQHFFSVRMFREHSKFFAKLLWNGLFKLQSF